MRRPISGTTPPAVVENFEHPPVRQAIVIGYTNLSKLSEARLADPTLGIDCCASMKWDVAVQLLGGYSSAQRHPAGH
jgi:hypothetical protein